MPFVVPKTMPILSDLVSIFEKFFRPQNVEIYVVIHLDQQFIDRSCHLIPLFVIYKYYFFKIELSISAV